MFHHFARYGPVIVRLKYMHHSSYLATLQYIHFIKIDRKVAYLTMRNAISVSYFFQLIEAEWRMYALVNESSLGQIMACRLVGANPLS